MGADFDITFYTRKPREATKIQNIIEIFKKHGIKSLERATYKRQGVRVKAWNRRVNGTWEVIVDPSITVKEASASFSAGDSVHLTFIRGKQGRDWGDFHCSLSSSKERDWYTIDIGIEKPNFDEVKKDLFELGITVYDEIKPEVGVGSLDYDSAAFSVSLADIENARFGFFAPIMYLGPRLARKFGGPLKKANFSRVVELQDGGLGFCALHEVYVFSPEVQKMIQGLVP